MVWIRRGKSGQIGLFLWNSTSFAAQPAGIENHSGVTEGRTHAVTATPTHFPGSIALALITLSALGPVRNLRKAAAVFGRFEAGFTPPANLR
jgi:hypothetical protein